MIARGITSRLHLNWRLVVVIACSAIMIGAAGLVGSYREEPIAIAKTEPERTPYLQLLLLQQEHTTVVLFLGDAGWAEFRPLVEPARLACHEHARRYEQIVALNPGILEGKSLPESLPTRICDDYAREAISSNAMPFPVFKKGENPK